MTDESIIRWVHDFTGCGSLVKEKSEQEEKDNGAGDVVIEMLIMSPA